MNQYDEYMDFLYRCAGFGIRVPSMQVSLESYKQLEDALGSKIQYVCIKRQSKISASADTELTGIRLSVAGRDTIVLPILPLVIE